MNVLLISTYEMGRQPFGLASPAAQLTNAGHDVACLDLSVQRLDEAAVSRAELVAFYLPMHTATRIALAALEQVRSLNPAAHLCAFGLYAPVSAEVLRQHGVATIIGGEFEAALVATATNIATPPDAANSSDAPTVHDPASGTQPQIILDRLEFSRPRRDLLPPLEEYAGLVTNGGTRRTVGYTEASRGCRHMCRHCPVVPVYDGRFRVVPVEVVLADIDQQVAAGATHITFGDPDFLNGPRHADTVVRGLHARHPDLTYDVTIKVEHLLDHRDLLPTLRDTGCAFITSAVESVDDRILEKLAKGHTAADFEAAVALCDDLGLALQPTFVAFNPWITLEGYRELLATIARLGLVGNVPSIQLAIRLLIPAGSLLLHLDDVQSLIGDFDATRLGYPWQHTDPRVDALQQDIERLVETTGEDANRDAVFADAWALTHAAFEDTTAPPVPTSPHRARATIPYLTEPWYC